MGDDEGLCIANRVRGGEGLALSLGFEGDRMRVGWGSYILVVMGWGLWRGLAVRGQAWRGLGQGGNCDELLGVTDTVRIWVRS